MTEQKAIDKMHFSYSGFMSISDIRKALIENPDMTIGEFSKRMQEKNRKKREEHS